ncbi:MAG: sulfatase [Pseudomonadales bacterium]
MADALDRPPNILLLVAEDLSPRIGAYGDTVARTPNLDRLARRAVRYTQVFTTAGVCAPSRAALVMGQHQISFGAQHMRTSTGPLGAYFAQPHPDAKAFPEQLRKAGYFTFTDVKLDYQFSGVAAGSGPFTIWDQEGQDAHWRNRNPDQPFFGMINFLETHESGVMRLDIEPYNAAHAATQTMRKRAGLVAEPVTDPSEVEVPPYYPDIPEVRGDLARHYDNIHAMDARVGAILDALDQDGLRDQTIVIWTTDHGDGLPRAKRELLDTGIHVPMLVDLPPAYRPAGWSPGQERDDIVSFVDLAPTILEWAGVPVPEQLHGSSFLAGGRAYAFASRDRIDTVPDRQRAVRDRRYKYIRSWSPDTPGGHELEYRDGLEMVRAMRQRFLTGQLTAAQARWFQPFGDEQLYDLATDPDELDNRAGDAELQAVRTRLLNTLIDWLARVGDSSVISEAELRDRLLVKGQIPVTPAPTVVVADSFVTLHGEPGASIGYRTEGGAWLLYSDPLTVPAGRLEAKAVRYGWYESPVVTWEPGRPADPIEITTENEPDSTRGHPHE